MTIPYRTRRFLSGFATVALILVLIAVLVWAVWLLWLDRFVVYTRDGAVIDFSLSDEYPDGVLASPPEEKEPISIYYNEGELSVNTSTELGPLTGFYASPDMLKDDMELVFSQIKLMPADSAIMLDMKDIVGYFYYDSSVGNTSPGLDIDRMNELLSYLRSSHLYTIARIPAFRDYLYALDHTSQGLTHKSGRYVYMDEDRTYWLDPNSEGTLAYLMQIVSELKALGFDEVVFDDFRYPDTQDIYFKGDRQAVLESAAQKLLSTCSTDYFCVSFTVESPTFPMPEGRTRMYLKGQSGGDVRKVADESGLEDPLTYLIFVTEANDTRFDNYSVIRPITSAHLEE